jgi:hypothetical protein
MYERDEQALPLAAEATHATELYASRRALKRLP